MKKSTMSAIKFRSLLITTVILLLAISSLGFYFAQNALVGYAKTVTATVARSTSTGSNVQSLKRLQEELVTRQDAIVKASAITATSDSYQTQAVKDLSTYATEAGITISNYSFGQAATATATPVAGASPQTSVILTLTSPMSYISLLKFLNSVESNLPKMQISSLNLSRVDGDSSSVKTEQITVQVYTR